MMDIEQIKADREKLTFIDAKSYSPWFHATSRAGDKYTWSWSVNTGKHAASVNGNPIELLDGERGDVACHRVLLAKADADRIAELEAENKAIQQRLDNILYVIPDYEQAPAPVYRTDDGRVVIFTNSYVSHRSNPRKAKSQYSITMTEAVNMRDDLSLLIAAHSNGSE